MDFNDILIKCDGRNFVKNKAVSERFMALEDLLDLCEDLYDEVDILNEKIDELEQDIQDNYIPVDKSEQYGISDSDFI